MRPLGYVERVARFNNKYCAELYIIGSLYLDVSYQYPYTHSYQSILPLCESDSNSYWVLLPPVRPKAVGDDPPSGPTFLFVCAVLYTVTSRRYAFAVPVHRRYVLLYRVLRECHIENGGESTKGSSEEGGIVRLARIFLVGFGCCLWMVLPIEACASGRYWH